MHTATLYTGALLAADVARPSGELWRPLLIFGVVAVLMALVVLVQMTDPRRRSRDEEEPDVTPPARHPKSTAPATAPERVVDGPAAGPEGG